MDGLANLREAPNIPTQICLSNPAAVAFIHELIDEVTTRIDQAVGKPSGPTAALKATTACGRNLSCLVSSSRVQTSLTGR